MAQNLQTIDLDISGALTVSATGGATGRWVADARGEVNFANAVVVTGPTGAALVVDILKNGTSVYGVPANRPTIAAGATASQNPGLSTGTAAQNTNVGAQGVTGATSQNLETPIGNTTAPTYAPTTFVQGDVISLSVVSVGSTVAGSDLSVTVTANIG